MVTTTVGVLDGVHRNTGHLRPLVPLGAVLVVGGTGLQERLVDTTATGDDANGATRDRRDRLLLARRELDPSLASLRVGLLLRKTERSNVSSSDALLLGSGHYYC